MDIWTVDKLALFILFFVPGFISIKVYDLMVPRESRDFSKSLFDAMGYSTLNFAALFPLIWLVAPHIAVVRTGNFNFLQFVFVWFTVLVVMVFAPCCWPFAYFGFSRFPFVAKHFVNPIQKPWDYIFGKRIPFWIIVHLRDGQRIGGKFGSESFASSNPAEEQIYLEELWILDSDGRFQSKVERSKGILVMKEEIRAVEFFGVE